MHSGVALINVAADGENSIAVAPGANSHLLPEDIARQGVLLREPGQFLSSLKFPLKPCLQWHVWLLNSMSR
jgi:ribokinase